MTKEQIEKLEELLALAITDEEEREKYAEEQGWKHLAKFHTHIRISLENAWSEVLHYIIASN